MVMLYIHIHIHVYILIHMHTHVQAYEYTYHVRETFGVEFLEEAAEVDCPRCCGHLRPCSWRRSVGTENALQGVGEMW
jgi:hypothetical protein